MPWQIAFNVYDEGEWFGIYHQDCGGKVWVYPNYRECDSCGRQWGGNNDGG